MRFITTIFLFLFSLSALAAIEAHRFDNEADEARYKVLVEQLRCLVCQNQNIADSNAELAQDLRQQTYEMIQAGKSNEEIITYMVDRYGDFVMYKPPVKKSTILLWVGPFIIMFVALFILIRIIRKRPDPEEEEDFDNEDLKQAEALLSGDASDSSEEKLS